MSLETEVRIDIVSNNEEYLSVNIKKKKGECPCGGTIYLDFEDV